MYTINIMLLQYRYCHRWSAPGLGVLGVLDAGWAQGERAFRLR